MRVIAATNRDLRQLVGEGRFHEDLYYRLNVIPIAMPPLRERREDIPLLVEHFIQRHAQRAGKRIDGIDAGRDGARCRRYDWPGNVRELENTDRARGRARAGTDHQGARRHARRRRRRRTAGLPSLNLQAEPRVDRARDGAARARRRRGVKKDAAESMGISQRALSYYLAKHRID